jgi:hypothetical protein
MSDIQLSIILASRIQGNKNSRLKDCLKSLVYRSENKESFEVLIKFDDDDDIQVALEEIKDLPINIKYIVTPRGKGYSDLHKAYLDLFVLTSASSELFWVISDDMVITTDRFDSVIINKFNEYRDKTCVLHTRVKYLKHSNINDAITDVDCYPIWTRKWLCTAGFGYSFSTDGWTSLLEYLLYKKHKIDNRVFVNMLDYSRHINKDIDGEGSLRWNNERKNMIDMVNTENFLRIARETSKTIAYRIKKEGRINNPFKEYVIRKYTRRKRNLISFFEYLVKSKSIRNKIS